MLADLRSKPGNRPEPTSGHPPVCLHDRDLPLSPGHARYRAGVLIRRPYGRTRARGGSATDRGDDPLQGDTARSLAPLACPCHPGVVSSAGSRPVLAGQGCR